MDDHTLSAVSKQFRAVANRLREAAQRVVKAEHLESHLSDYDTQAARLLITAIDGRAFSKERRQQNKGWWDRSIGRFPGGILAVYAQPPSALFKSGEMEFNGQKIALHFDHTPEMAQEAERQFLTDAQKDFTSPQLRRCWVFAISSWLSKQFPTRFRADAAQWDWWHAVMDAEGKPLNKRGRPIKGRWYVDGELASSISKLPDKANLQWKTDEAFVGTTDEYDDADWLEHQRVRAEVHADACDLLGELIEGAIDPAAPKPGQGLEVKPVPNKLPVPKKAPLHPTRVIDRGYAAKHWFKINKRTLDKWIEEGSIRACKNSSNKWVFDLDEVSHYGDPKARDDADPAKYSAKKSSAKRATTRTNTR